MGLGEENEPPKKKLKQAQLCFTPKSNKRKLVTEFDADDDDDVQFVKIVCKEPKIETINTCDKENQLSLNKPFPLENEKKVKQDVESLESISLASNKGESNIPCIDLCEENAFCSLKDVSAPSLKNISESKSNSEFSLSITDSILDDINNRSLVEDKPEKSETVKESSSEIENPDESKSEKDASSSSELETIKVSEDLNESVEDDELNETFKSDDGNEISFLSSNDDSTPNKTAKNSLRTPKRKLTPKRLESLKKRQEKERLKSEKKAAREKEKEAKIKTLEEEKKKKKEAKEQKKLAEQKLKEEERKVKDEERKKRDEEKKQKEEEKKKKEEEKRKREEAKEEEKRKKEEIEEKKKAAFAKFFKKSKQPEISEKAEEPEGNNFMPFPMKPDMKLAPQIRRLLNSENKDLLDSIIQGNDKYASCLYLPEIKSGKHTPLKTEGTWPLSLLEEEHDVIIIESTTNENCDSELNGSNNLKEKKKKMKAKLLQFHDNRRPPYWGTWRKRSKAITSRRPLGQDKVVFDYEVDSDSEWEDEGEGEDVDKEGDSDGEGSGEEEETPTGENGYLLDNTFVPHGYLSDEEVQPDEDLEDNDPENQKIRMTLLKQEFDEEMKTKTERLKPRLLGCVWISNGITEVSSGSLYEGLMAYRAVWVEEMGPIDVSGPIVEDSPTSTPQTKKVFPHTVLTSLVKFIHGCCLPLSAVIKEFLLLVEKEHPSEHVSKRAVTLKVKGIASKTYDYATGKPTWSVNSALLEEFGLKPLNEAPLTPPVSVPPVPVVEKPKEGPLLNFFKGSPAPPLKKRVSLITLSKPSFDYTPGKLNEHGVVKDFGTPRPVDPALRKRARLITLSSSIGNHNESSKSESPGTNTSKSFGVVDLTEDSQ